MATTLESKFQDLMLSENPINPGLFHLPINLNFQQDPEALSERKKLLEQQMRKEHETNHIVIKNLIAMANHKIPRLQIAARKELETILQEHPKHLNTLAYLETIYKELHRRNDADRCKQLKENILRSQDPQDVELKAQCVLEQGYALINEEEANHEGIANQNLRDSIRILSNEHQKSEGKRRENLRHAIRHSEQASSFVLNSMFCDRLDEKLQRKRVGIEKMIQGIKLLESIGKNRGIQYQIWKFYLGVAYNRFDFSLYQQEANGEKDKTRHELCGHVLQIFWDTVSTLPLAEETRVYIARSYAYIGHLIISRHDIVKDLKHFDPVKNVEFLHFLEKPLTCFDKAIELCPGDVPILNRYGRSLGNKSNSIQNHEEKYKLLSLAYKILSDSIKIMPHSNWFAYTTRMLTSRKLAFCDKTEAMQKWLENAREDGIQCFNSKSTETDLCILAKVCQMLAKYPDLNRYGPKVVQNKEYIHEAIQYLNYALQLGGYSSYTVVYTLSTCLYEIREYRTAVEWMKLAMQLSNSASKPFCLTRIGEYLIEFYKTEVENSKPMPMYMFDELRFYIALGKSKYSEINPSISDLCKYHWDGMMEFTKHLLGKSDAFSRELVESCLRYLDKYTKNPKKFEEIRTLAAKFETVPFPTPCNNIDLPRSSKFKTPDIVMPFSADVTVHNNNYKYDFFVSHSNVNGDWVKGFLMHQLETKLHKDDTAFKGCIADRDFTAGTTIIDNIVEAVENSHKVILIITKDFIESRWCDYEVSRTLTEMLSKKKEDDCIIPVLLEEVNIPEKINHITYLDLTDKTEHVQGIMKLKRVLSIDI